MHRLGSRLHQTRTVLHKEREAREQREYAPGPVEKPQTAVPRTGSPIQAQPCHDEHPKEGEWQAVTRHGQKGKCPPQGEQLVRDTVGTVSQTAPEPPKWVKSQVHRRTFSDEQQTSGDFMMESARRMCARTPER